MTDVTASVSLSAAQPRPSDPATLGSVDASRRVVLFPAPSLSTGLPGPRGVAFAHLLRAPMFPGLSVAASSPSSTGQVLSPVRGSGGVAWPSVNGWPFLLGCLPPRSWSRAALSQRPQ